MLDGQFSGEIGVDHESRVEGEHVDAVVALVESLLESSCLEDVAEFRR